MSSTFQEQLQHKIDHKTKPLGALGMLEEIAFRIASIQQTLTPELVKPHIVVFAASHGIAASGVSAYPSEVTPQMVLNFIAGGAAINVFTRQHGIGLLLADAGVDYNFEPNEQLLDLKVNRGNRNMLEEPAMTRKECELCLERGASVISDIRSTGCNVVGFGEMGIGNTSSAALIMSKLLDIPIEDCVGRGTGLDDQQLILKKDILKQVLAKHIAAGNDVLEVLTVFGGYEIAMMCGAMLAAADRKMIILVDGFIATVAYLCALQMNNAVNEYAIFCHQSDEKGHALLMQKLRAEPVLKLDLRLGEGTGCALAYPLLQSAVAFLNEMASFDDAGVSKKTP
jgi:nicotinate-nucleotide--dimethylbenzimidazole phosphoribosyltransferase